MIIKFIGMYTLVPIVIDIDTICIFNHFNNIVFLFLESKIVPAVAVVFLLIYFSVALYYYNL